MPFTVTHIAAAVPIAWLSGWRLPFTALAIGALVPDIGVFYPHALNYEATHSMLGIFTHCMPVGIVAYYFYQAVLKLPLVDLLPYEIGERLRPFFDKPINFSFTAIAAVIICVGLGASTHVFWDSFTHKQRWGVTVLPWLNEIVFDTHRRPIRWYAILQHGSSILLLPPMLIGFLMWVKKQPRQPAPRERAHLPHRIAWMVIVAMLAGAVCYFNVMRATYPHFLWVDTLRISVRDSGAVIMLIVLTYCFSMHVVWWLQAKNRGSGGVEEWGGVIENEKHELKNDKLELGVDELGT